MDDGMPIAMSQTSLDGAIEAMDPHEGFAMLSYKGREPILMSGEKFEQWEDAVDVARVQDSIINPDPEPMITLEELRTKYDIPPPGA